jgi:hypothetical protein
MAEIKRLNYFTSQFLIEGDFTGEQAYHMQMRRRHNSVAHTPGVADGLIVQRNSATEVVISPGTAIDSLGREIVLQSAQVHALQNRADDQTVFLTVEYSDALDNADKYPPDPTKFVRVTERPIFSDSTDFPPQSGPPPGDGEGSTALLLAVVQLNGSGAIESNASIDNSVRALAGAKLATQPVVSVEGVTAAAGGNIDLVTANAITISGNNTTKQITIGESHSATTNNPHATTAAQVGALPISGGTLTGKLQFPSIATVINDTGASISAQNVFAKAAAKAQSVLIGDENAAGTTSTTKVCLHVAPAAAGVAGIIIDAANGTDSIVVNGSARFNGNKIGYVVDTGVNSSGSSLRTGDLVKLNVNGSLRFHGDNNRIPIPEVVLADTAADPLVIGIVAMEATPSGDGPDTRTNPEDPTSIPPGGELFIVTLGAFAHCKVEAEKEPIRVGDLLTSSAKAGFAKRASDPKVGTIIGKALEPLASGTGYIAVFVNIQ